jgi:uncharacterized protein
MVIIGRQYEQKQLQKIYQSNQAEFVAVYGRRRVGKTYLIRHFFSQKDGIFFRSTGIHKGSLKKQLEKFKKEIELTFYKKKSGMRLAPFLSWHDAFEALKDAIELLAGQQKVVIFMDEIPWMATPKSGMLEALDYYWNRFWSEDKNIKLVICGSAASWIIDKVLHNKGGLHNRVTLRLPLAPFTLAETKAYLRYRHVNYNNDQLLMLYMCIGGIPYYLNFIERGLSAIQNINQTCFQKKGTLYDEFPLLFASLFNKHEIYEQLIRLIAGKRGGLSRSDIENSLDIKGGRLSKRLKELEEANFISSYVPWKRERGTYYKVMDEFSLFYLTWISPRAKSRLSKEMNDQYWETLSSSAAWKAWSGYAFEAVCFKHIEKIQAALHIPHGSEVFSWRHTPATNSEEGAQIDLIFDRPDNIVNLCEIKYYRAPFKLDKKYALKLIEREKIYSKETKSKKQIFHSFIVSSGLAKTMYSEDIIDSVATADDLFDEDKEP